MKSKKFKYIIATFPKEVYEEYHDDVSDMLVASEEMMLYVKDLLRVCTRNMRNILEHFTDYATYTKEEQLVFTKTFKLLKLTGKLCHTPLVSEDLLKILQLVQIERKKFLKYYYG